MPPGAESGIGHGELIIACFQLVELDAQVNSFVKQRLLGIAVAVEHGCVLARLE